ncbi:SDR family NAD(P)-dependent oxidoreductase [Streptomyces platensis]|uniref:Oxidoreductase n=1 Tax=Streptomyces platensis TaxID=58346 RepID=A0AAE6TMN2_STRPT|nr:SDR family NAD(P)-dependent oxidoreductase [Streptomyces platensis]OSY38836.1 putative oxidoreductase [Streptomyces platensis]QEV52590.1 SDR family NAD(P)-dependent oxidoreductase [Streptomyces platensis]
MTAAERNAGRTVVLTGANRGTGRAIAETLHTAGWRVWALGRTPTDPPWLRDVPCDLRYPETVGPAVNQVAEEAGALHAVVANGVVRSLGAVGSLPLAQWREAVDVNLTAVLALTQAALPHLRAGGGRIVLMGSHAGSRFFEGGAAYCATKAALKALAEVLLLEERVHGVCTTLVSPGAIASLPGDDSPLKMGMSSVARTVCWALEAPDDTVIGEIELRPARLTGRPAVSGLDRLQAV